MVRTDIFDRALPWTALILQSSSMPNDLNLDLASRASGVSIYLLLATLLLGRWHRAARAAALAPLGVLLFANRHLYRFFLINRGAWFLARSLPLHWLYYAYSTLAFGIGLIAYRIERWQQRSATQPFIRRRGSQT